MTVLPQDITEGSDEATRAGAHERTCAVDSSSKPALVPVPSLPSPAITPEPDPVPAPAGRGEKAAALLARPGTLAHAQPPTFHQALTRHRECSGHYRHPAVSCSRAAYGWFHTVLIKAPLNYIEWATSSPLGFLIHAVLGLAIWLGLLLGGYL
jgi:hypothetical protein